MEFFGWTATKFARRVWYLRQELEAFLRKKTGE